MTWPLVLVICSISSGIVLTKGIFTTKGRSESNPKTSCISTKQLNTCIRCQHLPFELGINTQECCQNEIASEICKICIDNVVNCFTALVKMDGTLNPETLGALSKGYKQRVRFSLSNKRKVKNLLNNKEKLFSHREPRVQKEQKVRVQPQKKWGTLNMGNGYRYLDLAKILRRYASNRIHKRDGGSFIRKPHVAGEEEPSYTQNIYELENGRLFLLKNDLDYLSRGYKGRASPFKEVDDVSDDDSLWDDKVYLNLGYDDLGFGHKENSNSLRNDQTRGKHQATEFNYRNNNLLDNLYKDRVPYSHEYGANKNPVKKWGTVFMGNNHWYSSKRRAVKGSSGTNGIRKRYGRLLFA